MPFVEIPSDVKALPKSAIPGILAGAIYDADSDDEDVLIRYHCEAMNFERTIDEAVQFGRLQPRAPGTCLPMRMATPTSVITVADLAQFLADIQCSVEIRRVEVNAAQPQAEATALATHERQVRRWQLCVDAGLPMPQDTYAQLPRGIGRIAKAQGITRQALAQDLNAHRERIFGR